MTKIVRTESIAMQGIPSYYCSVFDGLGKRLVFCECLASIEDAKTFALNYDYGTDVPAFMRLIRIVDKKRYQGWYRFEMRDIYRWRWSFSERFGKYVHWGIWYGGTARRDINRARKAIDPNAEDWNLVNEYKYIRLDL